MNETEHIKKILLVEDDPFLLDIYTVKLQHSGFDVETAVDGEQALQKTQEVRPDVIFLDIVLPLMDGWQVLEKLKEQEETSSIPVFVLSNIGQPEDVQKAMDMGAVKYFIKANHKPGEIVEELSRFFRT